MNMCYSDIYCMKLFDEATFPDKDLRVIRVPGGWLMSKYPQYNTTFVPFDNEFQINKNNKVEL